MRSDPVGDESGAGPADSPGVDETGVSPMLGARLIRLARLAAAEHMVLSARLLLDDEMTARPTTQEAVR